ALHQETAGSPPPTRPIPAPAPGSLIVSGPPLSSPGGAGTPEFRADRHPQACAQVGPAGHGYPDPAGPVRAAVWRIPRPDLASGRVGVGATAAVAAVRPRSAARVPRYRRVGRARPGRGVAAATCAVSPDRLPRP